MSKTPIAKTTPTTTDSRPAHDATGDELNRRLNAVTSFKGTDPNQYFTDPRDRSLALTLRAGRILNDPKYQALPDAHKDRVRSNFYDKYIVPGYETLNLPVPNKELWMRQIPKEVNNINPSDYFPRNGFERHTNFLGAGLIQGTREIFDGILYQGLKLGKSAAYNLLGLDSYLGLNKDYANQGLAKIAKEGIASAAQVASKMSNGIFDDATFWLNVNPSKTWMEKADTLVGEQIAQLPLYTALGAGMAEAGVGELATGLTGKLGQSAVGQYVGRRLVNGSEVYLGSMLTDPNASQIDRMKMFAWAMGIGAIFEGASGKIGTFSEDYDIRYPSRYEIKQQVSRTAAMGGRPLVEAVVDKAEQNLEKGIVGEPSDHIVDKMVTAEQMTLSAMGRQTYGKPWRNLSQSQRAAIRVARDKISTEAVEEIPIHNKDLAKRNVDNIEQKAQAQSPTYARIVARAEAFTGQKVSDSVFATEQEQLEQLHGIKQSQGTIEKIDRTPQRLIRAIEKKAARASDDFEQPRKFAQLKANTLQYFTNRATASGGEKKLAQEMKGWSSTTFHDFVKKSMGDMYLFENDEHALLWANAFRKDLPKPVATRLQRELHQLHPDEWQGQWDEMSKNLETHMGMLAISKRLFSEGNIFQATKVAHWLDRTQWQIDLQKEAELAAMKSLNRTMKRHPEARRMMENFLNQMQQYRDMSAAELAKGLKASRKLAPRVRKIED